MSVQQFVPVVVVVVVVVAVVVVVVAVAANVCCIIRARQRNPCGRIFARPSGIK